MQLLPVAHRELAIAARKPATARARMATAGIAFGIVLLVLWSHGPARLGPDVLRLVTAVLFAEALLAGVRYTSDALSEERREGTLGLLFLTPLNGFDVVAGKAAGLAGPALYNFLAVLPIFGLALLFGGVTGNQLLALSAVLIATNLLSLAAGLFVSSRGTGEKGVLPGTLLLVAGITAGPLGLWQIGAWTIGPDGVKWLLPLSPAFAFSRAGAGALRPALTGCAALGTMTLLLAALASRNVSRSWRQIEERGKVRGETARHPRRRTPAWRSLLHLNPVYWLILKNRRTGGYWLLGLGMVFFGVFCRVVIGTDSQQPLRVLVPFGSYGLHAFARLLLAAEAVRQINQDRRSGVLELVLTTPLPPSFILRGQKLAIKKLFAPVLGGLALMNLIWMTERGFLRDMFFFLPCSLALIFSDAKALLWRGMLDGLRGRRYARTVLRTFGRVMGPPLIALLLVFFATMKGGLGNKEAQAIIVGWTTAAIVYNLAVAQRAKERLRQFRSLAAGDKWNPAWVAGGARAGEGRDREQASGAAGFR